MTEAPLPPSDLPGNNRFAGRQYDAAAGQRRSPSAGPPPEPGHHRVVGPPVQGSAFRAAAATSRRRTLRRPPGSRSHQPPPDANGDAIEVQQGETLYGISRRNGVPVAAIKDANGLSSDAVRPGQRLVMPAGAHDRGPFAKAAAGPHRAAAAGARSRRVREAGAADLPGPPASRRPAGKAATP